jgi:CRP-like cAMP-binding protein
MCSLVKAQHFKEDSVVFSKGDCSFYVIIQGRVQVLRYNREGEVVLKTVIGSGRQFGQEEALSSQVRAWSVVAVEPSVLLVMSSTQFKAYLEAGFLADLETYFPYIERFLPSMKHCSYQQKVKVAQSLQTRIYKRGQVIVPKGGLTEHLCIVADGEASVIDDVLARRKSILRLAVGALLGEEGALLGERAKYAVICSSERAKLLCIQNSDVLRVLPEEVCISIVQQFKVKALNRQVLADSKARLESSGFLKPLVKDPRHTFIWATPCARRSLEKSQLSRSVSSLNSSVNDESFSIRKSILIKYAEEELPRPRRANVFRKRTQMPELVSPMTAYALSRDSRRRLLRLH